MSKLSNRQLAAELSARGLMPANCRIIEVTLDPSGPLVIRYEVFVTSEQLAQVADAMKAVAEKARDDEGRGLQADHSPPHVP